MFVCCIFFHSRPLHILILNAAVFSLPYTVTEDGLEAIFQINYLSHFYLTQLLENVLVVSAPARIVIVSSESHRFTELNYNTMSQDELSPPEDKYRAILAYNQSKMCGLLLQQELFKRLFPRQVATFAVHPGNMISTGITRNWWFWKVMFTFVRPFAKSKVTNIIVTIQCSEALCRLVTYTVHLPIQSTLYSISVLQVGPYQKAQCMYHNTDCNSAA
jgi:WW domain-containing oxidoreductase